MAYIVGLTGGLACGKTTALYMLQSLGANTLNYETIYKYVFETDSVVNSYITWKYGSASNKPQELCELLKARPDLREELEDLLEGQALFALEQAIDSFEQKSAEDAILVVEVSHLFELELEKLFNLIICITLPFNEQVKRAQTSYNGNKLLDIVSAIAEEVPLNIKAKRSEIVINNKGSIEDLQSAIRTIMPNIVKRASQKLATIP